MKLLFVGAHPDDIEFTCACTCQQAIELGWDVYEILMTSDEYGTKRNEFKGERIRRIRIHEMEEAAKAYGMNPDGTQKIKLIWFGEIDGHLPFNRDVFLRLKEKIIEIEPDIVIGPDSFFSLDLHNDHKHAGWLIYLVIKSLKPSERPVLLLYHSFNTNFYIFFKDISIQVKASAKHRSQISPLKNKILTVLRKLFYYGLNRIKTGQFLAEGFRRVDFTNDENQLKKLRHRIFYYFAANKLSDLPPERYVPTPKELDLL